MSDTNNAAASGETQVQAPATPAPAPAKKPAPAAAPEPNPETAKPTVDLSAGAEVVNPWLNVLVVCGPDAPAPKDKALVLVIQTRERVPFRDEDGKVVEYSHRDPSAHPVIKKVSYPAADAYLRVDEEVSFGDTGAAEVYAFGANVRQGGMRYFSDKPGMLNVGPAHPAFAAVDLAFQKGASSVELDGLSSDEVEQLTPFITEAVALATKDLGAEKPVYPFRTYPITVTFG